MSQKRTETTQCHIALRLTQLQNPSDPVPTTSPPSRPTLAPTLILMPFILYPPFLHHPSTGFENTSLPSFPFSYSSYFSSLPLCQPPRHSQARARPHVTAQNAACFCILVPRATTRLPDRAFSLSEPLSASTALSQNNNCSNEMALRERERKKDKRYTCC